MFKYTLPLLAFMGLAACDDSSETGIDETGDTGSEFDGATTIQEITAPHCDGGDIVFQVRTQGWTNNESLVNIWEQGSVDRWNEEHDLPSVDHGELGWWDELEQRVEAGASTYDRNEASLYACDGDEVGHANVYAIRVYDVDGNLADCAIFHQGFASGGDDRVDEILDDPTGAHNPVSDASEINSTNCEVWET